MTDQTLPSGSAPELTPRQIEVLRLFRAGLDIDEIARVLVISPFTARRHLDSIMSRFGFA